VPERGLEPLWVAPLAPKASASTNFATPAVILRSIYALLIFVVRDILLAVARKIPRPCLVYFACWRNMTPTRTKARNLPQGRFHSFCPPAWIRTRDHLLKRELLYQLSYGRIISLIPQNYVPGERLERSRGGLFPPGILSPVCLPIPSPRLEATEGFAPSHSGFADRRVASSPRGRRSNVPSGG
jgi:hypothetical protein